MLIADGDRDLVSSLKRHLSGEGHVVDVALNGEHALWHAFEFDYDAVILDVGLPGAGGLEITRLIRDRKPAVPVLMLVATSDLARFEPALRVISDGYVIKPFAFTALSAHLDAVTRGDARHRPTQLRVGDLQLNPATCQAWRAETELNLSPKEFSLLRVFLTHPGQVLTRRQILEQVWDRDEGKAPNLVDQYVLYLRRKVDRPFGVRQIETVRGTGYRLREQPTPVGLPTFVQISDSCIDFAGGDVTRNGHRNSGHRR